MDDESGTMKTECWERRKEPELIESQEDRVGIQFSSRLPQWMDEWQKEADCDLEMRNLFVSVLLSSKVFKDSGI